MSSSSSSSTSCLSMMSSKKRSRKPGSGGENQTQTFQNRVRDAFRRGLQWKWERGNLATHSDSQQVQWNGSSSHETATSSTQKRWQHIAPVAVQKIRRLFSTDTTNNVSPGVETGIVCTVEVQTPEQCCGSPDSVINSSGAEMVRLKTKDKESGEQGKLSEPFCDSSAAQTSLPLPVMSAESLNTDESTNPEAKQNLVHLSPTSSTSSSTGGTGFPVDLSSTLKSDANSRKNLDKMKASDKHISSADNSVSGSKPVDCDVEKYESFKIAPVPDCYDGDTEPSEHVPQLKITEGLQCNEKSVKRTEELLSSKNLSPTLDSNEIAQERTVEKNMISSALHETNSNLKGSTNPSIVLSTMDSEHTPSTPPKKVLEPLYLSLDSNVTSTSHTRKSPVTVQEWVDSIPTSSHLEEDPDDGNAMEEVLQTTVENQQYGDVCPLVQVRPASGQSGTVADQRREAFSRDASPSLQSDTGSHGSSVDSYLDARRPDPEEVLLGLGFGGPLHNTEAEVSRIPARFLQPSKVKGVAIDDFLRYQQDLIETFESGYSGYRGLTGGSQIPSVIVAKIMEKLREHERESSVKSSAGSSPGHHADISKRRFSRAAHRVTILTKMKSRDSIASGPAAHSVLNPDNRKFLDNQGSKSPEVSRKRMIIGHRSFTFDGEGQLIESEANTEDIPAPETSVPSSKPMLPRPLVHKDSVLSSATSLSLTSYDSDSDTDEASGGDINNGTNVHGLQRLLSAPVSFGVGDGLSTNVMMKKDSSAGNSSETRRRSLPSASYLLLNDLPSHRTDHGLCVTNDVIADLKASAEAMQTSTPERSRSWRDLLRVNSAPTLSPVSLPNAFSVLGTHKEESFPVSVEGNNKSENNIAQEESFVTVNSVKPNDFDKSSPPTPRREPSFYQITDFDLPGEPLPPVHSPESQSSFSGDGMCKQDFQRFFSLPKSSAMYLDQETRRKLSLTSADSLNAGSAPQTPDLKHWSTSSVSSWESDRALSPNTGMCDTFDQDPRSPPNGQTATCSTHVSDTESSPASSRRRGSLKRQQNVEEEDTSHGMSSSTHLTVDFSNTGGDKGDSFEMEELAVEDEVQRTRTGSAHSDSSGFQEEHNNNNNNNNNSNNNNTNNKERISKAVLGKQLSESEPILNTLHFSDEPSRSVEHLKRLSLPVIRVQDECGLIQWRASSFGRETLPFSCLRRVRSMPSQMSRIGLGRLCDSISPGSISDSIGNMFSSCSDESVIHLPRPSVDVTSEPDDHESTSLPLLLKDCEGESISCRSSKECCECNHALKKYLVKCHNDMQLSEEKTDTLLNIRSGFEAMKEAHNRIKNVVEQVKDQVCSASHCKMSVVVEQVGLVVQHQSNLCTQLEHLNSDLLSTVGISSAKNLNNCSNVTQHTNFKNNCSREIDSNSLKHSPEECPLLCQVIEKENQRLQELVRLNVDELARVRVLLEKLVPTMK